MFVFVKSFAVSCQKKAHESSARTFEKGMPFAQLWLG